MTNFTAGPELQTTDADFNSAFPSSAIRLSNGNILVLGHAGDNVQVNPNLYLIENDVYGIILNSTGTPVGQPFLVNTTTAADQRFASAAPLAGGGFMVVWVSDTVTDEANNSGTAQVMMQRFDAAGGSVGAETYLGEAHVQSQPAIVGLPDGSVVVYWTSQTLQGVGQGFGADGVATSSPNNLGAMSNFESVIYADGHVLATNNHGINGNVEVYIRDLGANGLTAGTDVRANSFTTSTQAISDAAVLADGGYVVTWQSNLQDGPSFGIYAQRYDSNGQPLGREFQVNTYTDNNQLTPDAAALTTGGYVIVWHSSQQDGSGYGAYGQVFDAYGNRQGGEFQINATTAGNQLVLQVVGLANGGFEVFWSGNDAGNAPEIFRRIYTPDSSVSLFGNDDDNTLVGGGGGDLLNGGDGADHMEGGGGNDTFVMENAGDFADGGDGNDRLIINIDSDDRATAGLDPDGVYRIASLDRSATAIHVESVELTNISNSNDVFSGLVGDDIIRGGGGFDTLYGGLGADRLEAGADGGNLWNGANQTVGLAAEDNAVDTLIGGAGADVIYAGLGDIADGGTQSAGQVDRIFVSFFGRGSALTLNLLEGVQGDAFTVLAAASGGTYSNFEEIGVFGSVFSDTVVGSKGNDRLFDLAPADGMGGDDSFYGMGGDDRISAGSGANYVDGGDGNDILYDTSFEAETLIGGAGNDAIFYGSTAPVDIIGNGADIINGGAGIDIIDYSKFTTGVKVDLALTVQQNTVFNLLTVSGIENLLGGSGNDTFAGNASANLINGGLGADAMSGGAGDDTFMVNNIGDTVSDDNNGGTDVAMSSVSFVLGSNVENLILSGTAALNATGNNLNNSLTGTAQANLMDGKGGADLMIGGAGNDTYIVDNAADAVTELSDEGVDVVQSSARFTLGENVERLVLTGTAGIAGTGNGLANVLTGNGGNNRLDGALGADSMVGGAGDDAYVVDDVGDRVFENANEGNDSVSAGFSYSLGSQYVENLTLTGTADLTATGNALANTLIGNVGNNVLNGGNGIDNLWGGAGNDTYYVDNVSDRTFEKTTAGADAGGHDIVYAGVRVVLDQFVEDLVITGTAGLAGTGNALNNTITGNSGNNALLGKDGNDVVDGGAGGDAMAGGNGDDIFYVDNVLDRVVEVNGQGNDMIYSSVSFSIGTQYIETLILTGEGMINATGNAIANYLSGNDTDNVLDGGRGNDTLQGRSGADVFVFGLLSGADTITDFSALDGDSVNLHAYANGVVNGGGIVIAQAGADTVITLGGGNVVTVQNALVVDVSGHIVW